MGILGVKVNQGLWVEPEKSQGQLGGGIFIYLVKPLRPIRSESE